VAYGQPARAGVHGGVREMGSCRKAARWSAQASRVVAWTANRGNKESKLVKFLAFTQNVEQVLGMPRLHLRHAFQGSSGQGKSKIARLDGRCHRQAKEGQNGDDLGTCCSPAGSRGFKATQGVILAVTAWCSAARCRPAFVVRLAAGLRRTRNRRL
jgi:hypothetical protein